MKITGNRRLGVNIDHVATLRRLRDTPYPNLLQAAREVVAGGAEQITLHLREDRRHIVDADVWAVRRQIPVDLNLEMAATDEMLKIALELKPFSICVVPEKREERTTEGGLDLSNHQRKETLKRIAHAARDKGILVSFFIEPDARDVAVSQELGAQAVELHTGSLCIAHQAPQGSPQRERLNHEWRRVREAVASGVESGVLVHAGHGIDYDIAAELGAMSDIREFNIGHAIVCEAVFTGIRQATARMKEKLGL